MAAWQIAAIISGCAAGVILIAAFVWINNNLLQIKRVELPFAGTEKAVRIVQLSDLHGKSFGKDNSRLINAVKKLSPDVIAVTGDLIHDYNRKKAARSVKLVARLSAICPVIYVSGNHEMRHTGYRFFRRELIAAGAEVLDNACVGAAGITFAGLNGAHNKNDSVFNLTERPDDKVLLAHMPHHVKRYAAAGFPIVLCGHAHGGQWRIPFTGIGIYAPGQGLFPKYVSGVYEEGKTRMIVSRGLGNSQFPLRLFNLPEITEITLVPPGAEEEAKKTKDVK